LNRDFDPFPNPTRGPKTTFSKSASTILVIVTTTHLGLGVGKILADEVSLPALPGSGFHYCATDNRCYCNDRGYCNDVGPLCQIRSPDMMCNDGTNSIMSVSWKIATL